jgi:hypothetical protein
MSTPVHFTRARPQICPHAESLAGRRSRPPAVSPLEAAERRYVHLLESYERLEKECALVRHDARDVSAERDRARTHRRVLIGVSCALLAGWAFTLWMDGRLWP